MKIKSIKRFKFLFPFWYIGRLLQRGRAWYWRTSKVDLVAWLMQKTHDMRPYDAMLEDLRQMEKGTVGKGLADLLDANNLRMIPRFEEHDLKHLLLGYGMGTNDELCMQFFLLGNGNRSFPCFLFASYGLFKPFLWKSLRKAYQRGRRSPSILHLTIENSKHRSLKALQAIYKLHQE